QCFDDGAIVTSDLVQRPCRYRWPSQRPHGRGLVALAFGTQQFGESISRRNEAARVGFEQLGCQCTASHTSSTVSNCRPSGRSSSNRRISSVALLSTATDRRVSESPGNAAGARKRASSDRSAMSSGAGPPV